MLDEDRLERVPHEHTRAQPSRQRRVTHRGPGITLLLCSRLSCLLRNHHALDLVVRTLRNDFLGDELILSCIRPAIDDLLRVGFADAWQGDQLGLARGVQIDECGLLG